LLPLDKERFVLEVLENIEPDAEFVAALRRLAEAGYHIALDDFVYSDRLRSLVELAETVKLDVRALDRRQLAAHVAILRDLGVRQLLAEKVETAEEFEYCQRLGFDLYQGYFLFKPRIVRATTISTSRVAALQLLARLQQIDVSVNDLVTLVSQDVSLSLKILQYVNCSAMGVRQKVVSIRQAIVMLGLGRLRTLAGLIMLSNLSTGPRTVMTTALVRATMCESLGRLLHSNDIGSFYIVGLFSMLDVMLDQPLEAVLKSLPLSDDVKAAIVGRIGLQGSVLRRVMAFERPEFVDVQAFDQEGLAFTAAQLQRAYVEAVVAVDNMQSALESSSKAAQTPAVSQVNPSRIHSR